MLARGSMSSLREGLGRRPDSQCRQERKRAEIRGYLSAKQLAKTEEAWSPADVPTKTSTGWTPPGDVKYAVEDVEQFVERFKKLL